MSETALQYIGVTLITFLLTEKVFLVGLCTLPTCTTIAQATSPVFALTRKCPRILREVTTNVKTRASKFPAHIVWQIRHGTADR